MIWGNAWEYNLLSLISLIAREVHIRSNIGPHYLILTCGWNTPYATTSSVHKQSSRFYMNLDSGRYSNWGSKFIACNKPDFITVMPVFELLYDCGRMSPWKNAFFVVSIWYVQAGKNVYLMTIKYVYHLQRKFKK